jgi:phage terminase large subunit-like protein
MTELLSVLPMEQIIEIVQELKRRYRAESIERFDPYPKQIEYFNSDAQITGFFAGNGTGKSDCAAIKTACHLTGKYPPWWNGPRFTEPIQAWCVGVTNESTRDNCQKKLFGPSIENPGDGWMDPNDIMDWTRRHGVSNAIDTMRVKHISGGLSYCTFKANEMGRAKLQGPRLHWIWGDEELDKDVFDELVFRMVGVKNARMDITFTPLKGTTELVNFLRQGEDDEFVRWISMSWSEAKHPDGRTHLTEEFKKALRRLYKDSPHIMRSREEGLPTIAAGLVYPFAHSDIFIKRFPLEKYWPRLAGIDVGFKHPTAAVAAAWDQEANAVYIYRCYRASQLSVENHCGQLKGWEGIRFAIDPASMQGNKEDGEKIFDAYQTQFDGPLWKQLPPEKRTFFIANNSVLAGINNVYERFERGGLYIFDDLVQIKEELSMYQWDEKTGRPVKVKDDLLDAIRYLVMEIENATILGRRGYDSDITITQWHPPTRGY